MTFGKNCVKDDRVSSTRFRSTEVMGEPGSQAELHDTEEAHAEGNGIKR